MLSGATAVINLAGTSIAGGRWTAARKAAIRESRTQATGALVRAIADAAQPPATFISSSAVGYYGVRGDEPATETTPPGSDFLAEVCRDWEAIASQAANRLRVVMLRSGVVFAREGGALPQLAAAVQAIRRWTCRQRPAVRLVDPRARLGGDGEVGVRHHDDRRAPQRYRADARHE